MRRTSLSFQSALLPDGWAENVRVDIADGRIARVTAGSAAEPGDESHAIGLPGMPNLHSHAFQRAMAGLTERRGAGEDSFWTWRDLMYRFVERLDPETMAAVAAMAFVEMLEAGFTRVGEFHYVHHAPDGSPYADRAAMAGALVEAARETGIALTLLPVFYAQGGFGAAPPGEAQRRFINTVDSYAALLQASRAAVGALPDAVVGVAPHSLRAVAPDQLSAIVPLAGGGPVHIHIAEQEREVADCLAWSGARPVEWLLANAPVDRQWCTVHATHMTDAETSALARSGAVAGLCPITEANLGDGLFPARAFLDAGGAFGVGSDSNVRIDCAEELRLLEYGQRLVTRRRNVLAGSSGATGADLFRAALAGGGQALGRASGIAVGNCADIFSLATDHPSVVHRTGDELLDAFVFAGGGGMIDRVWRGGVVCVEDGRHVARDAMAARYRGALGRLLA